ncbi:glycosyltransferase [Lacinutrix sp. Bg11-31]|uniref:glycosyltransferase n=1 Tax=Lacinutrix sp. Bg11-31 TaxID=2057808 RepID=UPI000C31A6AC|nr:glycosyltransferase [Lacinutrix sp. Bg11-31]AUC82947.1 glycosyltransferase [Lacinutrix sp. Bg11-31]
MKQKKITIILPSLKAGGAERVLSFISKKLDKNSFEVTLLVLGFKKDGVYNIDDCNTVFLNKKRLLYAFPLIIKYIVIAKPNIILSSVTHVNLLMAILSFVFYKTSFVAREASVVSKISEHSKSLLTNRRVIRFLYPRFKKIICQSQDMQNDLKTIYKINEDKLIVINNPITQLHHVKDKVYAKEEIIKFITVGRLSKEKGHERILKSLQLLDYNFHYTIIGDGPLKNEIRDLVLKLEIKSKVSFIDYTNKVSEELRKSDIFLQGSYVEGFPNAVLESCVVGTPVLAFNAPGGTKEIIKNDITGYLVNTKKEWKNKLDNIEGLLQMEPNTVSEYVKNKFSDTTILNKYEQLFKNLN